MNAKRSFYYLWGSQALSNLVDAFYLVALITYVLNQTHSVIFATMVPLMRVSAQLLSGLAAPLMIVRYRLPFLLTVSQLGQFLLFGALAVYLSPHVEGTALLPIYAIIAAISFLDGWTTPARNALVPRLVRDEALLKANGMIATTDQIIQFAGWAVSGVLVASFGSFPVLLAVAAGFGVAMAVTLLIEDPTESKRRSLWDVRTGREYRRGSETRWNTLKEGWQLLWQSRRLRSMSLMDMTDALGSSVWVGAFLLVFVQDVLHKDEQWWGYINAGYFAGTVLGGILVIALVRRLENRLFLFMIVGLLGYAMCTAVFAINKVAPLTLLIVLVTGPFTELSAISRKTLIQRSCTRDQLPKVFSAQNTLMNLIFGVSLLLMSYLAERLGIVSMYLIAAAISAAAAGVGWSNRNAFAEGQGKAVNGRQAGTSL
ncbi:MFS transporter [Cohnella sp. AR92]|uniref:MFS transporter n=1 Tax=Cohnella sp. AR92 TaxID=648716 RepID=UPI000F8EE875|nr:MFS transporter [Cohnella sp. AR92]RUS46934.1 MFS transporter [Cohnella sp. AR92]